MGVHESQSSLKQEKLYAPISNYDPPKRYFFITTPFLITEMHTSHSMQPKFLFLPFLTFTKEKHKLLTRFGLGLSLISLKWLIPF